MERRKKRKRRQQAKCDKYVNVLGDARRMARMAAVGIMTMSILSVRNVTVGILRFHHRPM